MMYLMGPRAANLDMEALKKYNFDPMRLLGQLTDIYVQCATPNELGDRFAESLVTAARYDANLLDQAAHTLRSLNYDSDKVSTFEAFVARVKVGRWGARWSARSHLLFRPSPQRVETRFLTPFRRQRQNFSLPKKTLERSQRSFSTPLCAFMLLMPKA